MLASNNKEMEHAQTQHVFDYANVSMVIFIEPIYATDTDHDSARTEQLKDEMGAITFYRGSSVATRRTLGNSIIIAPKEDTYSRVGTWEEEVEDDNDGGCK